MKNWNNSLIDIFNWLWVCACEWVNVDTHTWHTDASYLLIDECIDHWYSDECSSCPWCMFTKKRQEHHEPTKQNSLPDALTGWLGGKNPLSAPVDTSVVSKTIWRPRYFMVTIQLDIFCWHKVNWMKFMHLVSLERGVFEWNALALSDCLFLLSPHTDSWACDELNEQRSMIALITRARWHSPSLGSVWMQLMALCEREGEKVRPATSMSLLGCLWRTKFHRLLLLTWFLVTLPCWVRWMWSLPRERRVQGVHLAVSVATIFTLVPAVMTQQMEKKIVHFGECVCVCVCDIDQVVSRKLTTFLLNIACLWLTSSMDIFLCSLARKEATNKKRQRAKHTLRRKSLVPHAKQPNFCNKR